MTEEKMIDSLKELLTPKRMKHSLGVMKTCVELSRVYNCDEKKARIAGLLHDCAKCVEKTRILKLCNDFGIVLDDIYKVETALIHAPLGAEFARRYFKVKDEEILEAIRSHTTGKQNMSLLSKVVFIADYIEPNRVFNGVDNIRKVAYQNIDNAIILGIDNSIEYIIKKGRLLHSDTVKARNYLLLNQES